jgi:hypothetical protein
MDMSQKKYLVDLTNSQGWLAAKKIAENKLTELDRQALDCDDETSIPGLVRGAKFARQFWNAFLNTLENAKKPEEAADNDFVEISY